VGGFRAPTQSSRAIESEVRLNQPEPLATQLRLLWPVGVALALTLGVAAAVPGSLSGRVWFAFFALGTVLPATVALVLSVDPRKAPPPLTRVIQGLALLISGFALGLGVIHGAFYRWEVVAALIQVLAVVGLTKLRRGSEKQPGGTVRMGSVVLIAAVSLGAWGVAGSLLWWHFPFDAGHRWALVILVGSAALVAWALWRPDAFANRLVGWVGTPIAVALLGAASLRTNGLFDISSYEYHWDFYVGPAELIRQGGWLLWDVPAQYGFLSELAIAWMPMSSPWEGLFILNSVMSFLLVTAVFMLLRSLGHGIPNLLMSFIVALVACFFRPGLSDVIAGPNDYPSTGSFRFLWCVALLLILMTILRFRTRRARLTILVLGNLVWIVGVLWSAESAIYSTFVWLPGYFLMLVAEHRSQPEIRRRILSTSVLSAVPVVVLAAALATVFVIYQIGLGHGPDLRAFYEFGLVYQGGLSAYPIDPGGPGWVLFLAFAATVVTLVWNVRKQPAATSVVLVATAALIYSTSSYFVGRSHPNNVWNLAPEICIALAATLTLPGPRPRGDPVPNLLRLVAAPVLIILLLGALGKGSALVDWVTRPQHDIIHIDTALLATNPSLRALLSAHVRPDDRIAYLATDRDPVLSPYLYGDTVNPNGPPHWLPLAPFAEVNYLPHARGVTYLERFIARHPDGGWLIERSGQQSKDRAWVIQVIERHFTPGPTYSNADFQLTLWQPRA
jgi:hypothetical protein